MGAEVGVRKIDEDGDVTEEGGDFTSGPSKAAWLLFFGMLLFDVFGVWKVLELIHVL